MFNRVLSEQCRVEFRCRAPNARTVCLVGPFNHWDPTATPMNYYEGEWVVELNLPPGLYHFKYVVDGNWCCYPEQWQHDGGEDDGECLGCVCPTPTARGIGWRWLPDPGGPRTGMDSAPARSRYRQSPS